MTLDTKIVRRHRYMVVLSGLLLALMSSLAIACMGDEAATPDNDCPSGNGEPPQVQTNDPSGDIGQGTGTTGYGTMDGGAASGSGASGSGGNSVGGGAGRVGQFNATPSDIEPKNLGLGPGSATRYTIAGNLTYTSDHFASAQQGESGYHHNYWINTSCVNSGVDCGPIAGSQECWEYPDGKQICMVVPD